jgi:hypothetical protein
MKILEKITNLISPAHREAVTKLYTMIKQQFATLSKRQTQFEATRLLSKIAQAEKSKVLKPRFAVSGQRISSQDHNENFESIYIDLLAIYRQISFLNSTQAKQGVLVADDINKSKAAVLKLINDANVYTYRSRYPQFDDVKLINFNTTSNLSKYAPKAKVDDQTRLLKLPEIVRRRNANARRGLRTTNVDVEIIGGLRGQVGNIFPPSAATDSKVESFWSEAIYAEIPIEQTYSLNHPASDGSSFVNVKGPIAKVSLTFSSAEPLNQVKILPFGLDPIKVIEILYRPSTSSEVYYSIPDFIQEESLDWMEFNFDTLFVAEVVIVFTQENHRELNLKVAKSVLYSTDFLIRLRESRAAEIAEIPNLNDVLIGGSQDIYDEAIKDLESLTSFKELEKSPITEIDLVGNIVLSIGEVLTRFNPKLKGLLEEVSNFTETIPIEAKQDIVTIKQNEYVVGAREIECNYVLYSPLGNYESVNFEPASNIVHAEFEVDERHVIVSGNTVPPWPQQQSSTEWEVEFAPDRRAPIFPRNQVNEVGYCFVKDELLQIDRISHSGNTRFSSLFGQAHILYENGFFLHEGVDYETSWVPDGKLGVSISNGYDPKKIYTFQYYATHESKSIDVQTLFNPKQLAKPDTFEAVGTDFDITLSTYPHVNFGAINHDDFVYSSEYGWYNYLPPAEPYATGLARIYPNWTANGTVVTGYTGVSVEGTSVSPGPTVYGIATGWYGFANGTGDPPLIWDGYDHDLPAWSSLDANFLESPYAYYIQIKDIGGAAYRIIDYDADITGQLGATERGNEPGWEGTTGRDATFYSGTLTLDETPVFPTGYVGTLFSTTGLNGTPSTGISGSTGPEAFYTANLTGTDPGPLFDGYLSVPYSIVVAALPKEGGEIWGINNNFTYEPIKVTVGGTEAKNISEYHNVQQNAFSLAGNTDGKYEFIHDKKTLYFNQAISSSEIKVDYKWMVKYVKVRGTLRANKLVNPTITPQINELRLFMNTSVL